MCLRSYSRPLVDALLRLIIALVQHRHVLLTEPARNSQKGPLHYPSRRTPLRRRPRFPTPPWELDSPSSVKEGASRSIDSSSCDDTLSARTALLLVIRLSERYVGVVVKSCPAINSGTNVCTLFGQERMLGSISRSHEEASKDVEWPGPDTRRWKQTLIAPLSSAQKKPDPPPETAFVQTKLDAVFGARAVRGVHASAHGAPDEAARDRGDRGLVRPLSPSL